MVEFIGMLKVKVVKGTNLAIRDMRTSDPYVVLKLGQQVGCFQWHILLGNFFSLLFYFFS
jgi:Ca2+-dependent lipid-binding protein